MLPASSSLQVPAPHDRAAAIAGRQSHIGQEPQVEASPSSAARGTHCTPYAQAWKERSQTVEPHGKEPLGGAQRARRRRPRRRESDGGLRSPVAV
jgi:hypothetical protein